MDIYPFLFLSLPSCVILCICHNRWRVWGDSAGYQVADLVDLGDYQAIDLVGLVDREGLDLHIDL